MFNKNKINIEEAPVSVFLKVSMDPLIEESNESGVIFTTSLRTEVH